MLSFLAGCLDENVGIVGVCPIVESTNPLNAASNVPLTQVITATFNEAMNPETITQEAFSLVESGSAGGRTKGNSENQIPGELTYNASNYTLSFVPQNKLKANTIYTGTVAASVKD